jgi:glycerophosphoryl diester phosphodiesterase
MKTMNLHSFRAALLLQAIKITIFSHAVHSLHLQDGQCPLKIPSSLSSKSSTQLSGSRRPDLLTIAHRGASFSIPEHTLAAYRLALELGADYIEPDLVATKDGRLVAVHSIDLNRTTNIAGIYPERYRTIKMGEEEEMTGYFVFDFTLDELASLRVKQRIDGRSTAFDWIYGIPTLHQILDLLHEWNNNILLKQNQTRRSGVYIELKSSAVYKNVQNVSIAELFLEDITQHPLADEMFFNVQNKTIFGCEKLNTYQVPPLVMQCFDGVTLHNLHKGFLERKMALPPLVLLANNKRCHSPMFWYDVEKMNILSGVGPDKKCILDDGGYEFMIDAKKLNIAVHPWVTRGESEFVTPGFKTAEEELRYMYCKRGIHGIFTENVNLGIEAGYRGCDDYKTAEELLKEDIIEIEEEDSGQTNGTISKEICSQHGEDIPLLSYFASILFGLVIGILGSMILPNCRKSNQDKINHGKMKGMQTVSTDDVDVDMEII